MRRGASGCPAASGGVSRAPPWRFRPIIMTTLAAMLGVLPLALGAGTGSELRRPLGVSIVGGLLLSQLLTLYTTPVVYLFLERWRLWITSLPSRLRGAGGRDRGAGGAEELGVNR